MIAASFTAVQHRLPRRAEWFASTGLRMDRGQCIRNLTARRANCAGRVTDSERRQARCPALELSRKLKPLRDSTRKAAGNLPAAAFCRRVANSNADFPAARSNGKIRNATAALVQDHPDVAYKRIHLVALASSERCIKHRTAIEVDPVDMGFPMLTIEEVD